MAVADGACRSLEYSAGGDSTLAHKIGGKKSSSLLCAARPSVSAPVYPASRIFFLASAVSTRETSCQISLLNVEACLHKPEKLGRLQLYYAKTCREGSND